MKIRLSTIGAVLRAHGPRWLLYRLGYAIRLKGGFLARRTPVRQWKELSFDSSLKGQDSFRSSRFFFNPVTRANYQSFFARFDSERNPVIGADQITQGKFPHFSHHVLLRGIPPKWHLNPFTGESIDSTRHWSTVPDFGKGDIKAVWEINRFGFVYDLVRAYWRTGHEDYAECFWQLVEDWKEKNPPQAGVNWKCGQEITFRVMAWCFGLYGYLSCKGTTAERVEMLVQMIAVSAQRIEANLDYALSQRNNHGISEGVGLWTVGLLFPGFQQAAKWRDLGRKVLEQLALELIYEDGSFVQHSMNYHRVMLHDYLWALRLGELNSQPLSNRVKDQLAKAALFLYQLQETSSGEVPNYGLNDGAMILPLNNCHYRDFRPVLQAAQYLTAGSRLYPAGPWDEDLLWLFGPEALKAPVEKEQQTDLLADSGGYYTLRSQTGFAFIRCGKFRDRPGHADLLHTDIWWNGFNIAMDPGTFSYNAPEPWNNPFACTSLHNTVTVDGADQMERVSKFVWLPWIEGRARCYKMSAEGQMTYWEGEINGYHRLKPKVDYVRGILRLGENGWLVLDSLNCPVERDFRLHWLFPDLEHKVRDDSCLIFRFLDKREYHVQFGSINSPIEFSLVRADKESPRGWYAPYYFAREPALSGEIACRTSRVLFWTLFSEFEPKVRLEDGCMRLSIESSDYALSFSAASAGQLPVIQEVDLSGDCQDRLEL